MKSSATFCHARTETEPPKDSHEKDQVRHPAIRPNLVVIAGISMIRW